MDWFLYDIGLRHEWVKLQIFETLLTVELLMIGRDLFNNLDQALRLIENRSLLFEVVSVITIGSFF